MIQNTLKIDIPVAVALAHVQKDLCREGGTVKDLFVTKAIKEIKSIQVLTPYGGMRVDGKGINPFVIFPKSDAEIVAARARTDAAGGEKGMSPQMKLYNGEKGMRLDRRRERLRLLLRSAGLAVPLYFLPLRLGARLRRVRRVRR